MIKKFLACAASALACLSASCVLAVTPSGGWTLVDYSPNVRDYHFRVDVDPGDFHVGAEAYAPSSVYFAQYLGFQNAAGGYLGLQRAGGRKLALVSIWQDKISDPSLYGARPGVLPVASCFEGGACTSLKGDFNWLVGHQYRFRVMPSPSGENWWRIVLTDLTTSTAYVLGELRTPGTWGGISQRTDLFLEYFWGPYRCDTLRHTKATYFATQGNYGKATLITAPSGRSYAENHECSTDIRSSLPELEIESSSYLDGRYSVVGIGNAYRGLHRWPNATMTAIKDVMYSPDPVAKVPVIYRALRSGVLGAFPAGTGIDQDWQFVGRGYPLINDLYLDGQRLYDWAERGPYQSEIGHIFAYDNPYTGDLEYFRKNVDNPGYFPIDKSSSAQWTYLGRHASAGEGLKPLRYNPWDAPSRVGRVGRLYKDTYGRVFRLKTVNPYGYFPTTASDNTWWEFVGY